MSDSPIPSLARRAALAAAEFRSLDTAARRAILLTIADTLETRREAILAANAQDLAEARDAGRRELGLGVDDLDLFFEGHPGQGVVNAGFDISMGIEVNGTAVAGGFRGAGDGAKGGNPCEYTE